MNEFEYKNPYDQQENNNPYQQGDSSNTYSNPYYDNSSNSDEGGDSNESSYYDKNEYGVINNYNGYQQPKKEGKGLAIASMILGILSTTCCCCSIIGFFCALVALILGIIAQKRSHSGMSLAGIITGSFGLVFGVIGIAYTLVSGFFTDLIAVFTAAFEEIINGSYIEDSSSFNNNNNAIIGVLNLIRGLLK
jgi:uncharacterized membrane protein YphA (DoxX/SURF4 family)